MEQATRELIDQVQRQIVEVAYLRGALAKVVMLEASDGDEPLDDAIRIARDALTTTF